MSSPQREQGASLKSPAIDSPSSSSGSSSSSADTGSPSGSQTNQDNKSSGEQVDPLKMFVSAPPGFDPSDNTDIRKLVADGKGKGVSKEGGHEEDPIESVVESKIAELKKLREVGPEEETRLREKIRKQESGRWLESVRSELVGKTTVPIEYFNRLVAENEGTIGYVARHTARSDKLLQEKDAKLKELQGRTLTNTSTQTTSNKDEETIQGLQARVTKLEDDLKTARETGSRHYNTVQHLDQAHKDALSREQSLKDDVRKSDQEAKDLQKHIDDLTRKLTDCNAKGTAGTAGKQGEDDKLTKDNARLLRENDDLKKEIQRLTKITSGSGDDKAAQLKELSDNLASRDRRNRELMEQNQALESERLQWMGGIKKPEWWDQVEKFTKAKRSLDLRVLALYIRLGFTEPNLDGEAAIARLNEALDKFPAQKAPLMMTLLQQSGELAACVKTMTDANNKVAQLQKELDRAKRPESREELLASLKIFKDEDVEKRVDARCTMFINQREGFIRNIASANEGLRHIEEQSPDGATKDAIKGVRRQFLSWENQPQPQPARHRKEN